MVYLTATLLPHSKSEFINIIKIRANDIYIFQLLTSCPNIIYFAVKYKENELKRGDIIVICKLIDKKLKEYSVSAKIIIYSSSIVIT